MNVRIGTLVVFTGTFAIDYGADEAITTLGLRDQSVAKSSYDPIGFSTVVELGSVGIVVGVVPYTDRWRGHTGTAHVVGRNNLMVVTPCGMGWVMEENVRSC